MKVTVVLAGIVRLDPNDEFEIVTMTAVALPEALGAALAEPLGAALAEALDATLADATADALGSTLPGVGVATGWRATYWPLTMA
jgi:hypothetical protein